MNTVGTDTCLNQVSKKNRRNLKENNQQYFDIFEMCPEEVTEKKIVKIDWKKKHAHHKRFINSDWYKKSLIWWAHCKKNRLYVN